MNNQAKNVGASSLFGPSGMTPQPQSQPQLHHPNPIQHWNHPTPLFSQPQSHPHAQIPGLFQFSEPQSHVLAAAQTQYAQAQLQSQPARAHPQLQTQSFARLHNVNTNTTNDTSTPPTGSARRATPKPPTRPHNSSSMNHSTLTRTMELTPASWKKKQKPEKVAALLPNSAFYTQLLDFEAQVDTALARKKIDLQEARLPPHVLRTLRVYVFNTFSNHAKMDSDNNKANESSWSLKITGRILDNGMNSLSGISQRSSPSYPKFSAFFKKITIHLDQSLYPDDHVIVWDSARSPTLQDGFEVKRKGNKEFTAAIVIEMNYTPEKFMVSPQLSKLLGIEVETRPRIIASLFNYMKSRKLRSPNDPSLFICDPSLQRVFGEEKMNFTLISQKLSQHLSQPQPIHLEHKIKLSGHSPAESACYDIQVDVPFPMEKDKSTFLASLDGQKEIEAYDEAICASIKNIQEHHRRRAFFLSFSQSPAEFISTLIASQSKDIKLVARDAIHNVEKELRTEFFNQPWVEDAVIRYLNRKTTRSDAPGRN